jgi:hypothetical protein
MIEISHETRKRIKAQFPREDWRRVSEHLLIECGDNLPLVDSTYGELAERIRCAVVKLSAGNYEKLVQETAGAAKDWRDTLVTAGFGDDTKAHLSWLPDDDNDT